MILYVALFMFICICFFYHVYYFCFYNWAQGKARTKAPSCTSFSPRRPLQRAACPCSDVIRDQCPASLPSHLHMPAHVYCMVIALRQQLLWIALHRLVPITTLFTSTPSTTCIPWQPQPTIELHLVCMFVYPSQAMSTAQVSIAALAVSIIELSCSSNNENHVTCMVSFTCIFIHAVSNFNLDCLLSPAIAQLQLLP